MRKGLRVLLLLFWLLVAFAAVEASAESPSVYVLRVKGTVNPALEGYIDRGLSIAEREGAVVAVIELDTPGGLGSAMEDIVQRILRAQVPVVVYVYPAGAKAASAGVLITMSAHVAAMAPGTHIGAMHPVVIGSTGEAQELPKEMTEKLVNDTVGSIKSVVQTRNRNVDWAERAVRESAVATAEEAVEQNIVDLMTTDLNSLLSEIDGRTVMMLDGSEVTLLTESAVVRNIDMSLGERFLFTISNPTIAYIFLTIAMTGIFLELASPGAILPSVAGGIALLLAFYSLGVLPTNYAGLALMVLAFAFFLGEVFVSSHGALGVGGVAAFAVGSTMLFSGASPIFVVDGRVIAGVVAAVAVFFALVITAIVHTHRRRQPTGREGMVGKVAVAKTPLDPLGTVFVHGERWQAISEEGHIEAGEEVIVTKVDGLKLRVTKTK